MDKQRDALADALYKKGLALIQLEEDDKTDQVSSFCGRLSHTQPDELKF